MGCCGRRIPDEPDDEDEPDSVLPVPPLAKSAI
jgi:hypothetical protein